MRKRDMIKGLVGIVILGGALLWANVNSVVSEGARPADSGQGSHTPASREDALLNVIDQRVELDVLRELRAGR